MNEFCPSLTKALTENLIIGIDDSFAHTEVVEEFKKVEDVKKYIRKECLKQGLGNPKKDDI